MGWVIHDFKNNFIYFDEYICKDKENQTQPVSFWGDEWII